MEAAELRALQAPLKDRYREDPASALTPLNAVGRIGSSGVTFDVDQFAGTSRAGLHRSTGGDGSDACSGDMLLQALLACAGVTMRSVATAMGIELRGGSLHAGSDMDARGTLGVSREAPVGLGPIEMVAELDTDADDRTLAKVAELTERYCVVAQSLAPPVHLTVRRAGAAG